MRTPVTVDEGGQGSISALEGPFIDREEDRATMLHDKRETPRKLKIAFKVLARSLILGIAPGKIDDCLIRRRCTLGKKKIGNDPLIAIGRIEGYPFLNPFRPFLPRFHAGLQIRLVVGKLLFVSLKNRVRNWLFFVVIRSFTKLWHLKRCLRYLPWIRIESASKPVFGRTVHGRSLTQIIEHIWRIVPGTSPDQPSFRGFV